MVTGWAAPGRAEMTGPGGVLEVDARTIVLATGAPRTTTGCPPGSRDAAFRDIHDRPAPAVGPPRAPPRRATGRRRGCRACLLLGGHDPEARRRPPGGPRHGPPAPAVLSPVRPLGPVRPQGAGLDQDVRGRRVRARQRWTRCSSGVRTATSARSRSTPSSSPGTSSRTTSWRDWPVSPSIPAPAVPPALQGASRPRPGIFAAGNVVHPAETADVAAPAGPVRRPGCRGVAAPRWRPDDAGLDRAGAGGGPVALGGPEQGGSRARRRRVRPDQVPRLSGSSPGRGDPGSPGPGLLPAAPHDPEPIASHSVRLVGAAAAG